MSIDISRKRFKQRRNHSDVVMQQGRVQLDSDWNEAVAIRDRRNRSETYDIFGACAVPGTTPDAFEISAAGATLEIGRGRMYVDGIQAENHGDDTLAFDRHLAENQGQNPIEYEDQPFLPEAAVEAPIPAGPGTHLAYLDVWQREVNHLIEPSLVEKAVGVDTTARIQTVWQVKILENVGDVSCATPDENIPGWNEETEPSAGRLTTGPVPVSADPDPCLLPPTGGYKGLENHTYRVEIHRPGIAREAGSPPTAATATFKWSRDNGTVAAEVTSIPELARVRVDSFGRDEFSRFHDGDWVEVTDSVRELHGEAGHLSKVTLDEADSALVLETPLPGVGAFAFTTGDDTTTTERRTRVRRWDQSGQVDDVDGNPIVDLNAFGADGAIPVPVAGTTIELEKGVGITFETPAGGRMRTGDHWIFVARTVDATVEELDEQPPCGIHHHYCRLAVIHQLEDGVTEVIDCRDPSACGCCCEISVRPGQSVQAAIDRIPALGGKVCLEPGVHRLRRPLRIDGRRNLVLKGCGPGSKLVLDRIGEQANAVAALYVAGSHNIQVETLSLHSDESSNLIVVDEQSREVTVSETVLVNATPRSSTAPGGGAQPTCVLLGDCASVAVEQSKLLGRRGIAQATSAELGGARSELDGLRPIDPGERVDTESPDDATVNSGGDDIGEVIVVTAAALPSVETIEELRIDDNLILADHRGVDLQDARVGRIRDNRIAPAGDLFDDFERPSEETGDNEPIPNDDGVDLTLRLSPEDEFFEGLDKSFEVLVWTDQVEDNPSGLGMGVLACLLHQFRVERNWIRAHAGCGLHYSREVLLSQNDIRGISHGIATGFAFDLEVADNRISIAASEQPEESPDFDLDTVGKPQPLATAVSLDFARGARVRQNTIDAPSGIVIRKSDRSNCPEASGESVVRVLGIRALWRLIVEFAWIIVQFARLLDSDSAPEEGPTRAEFRRQMVGRLMGLLAGRFVPSFLGKASFEGNRLCIGRFGILARQALFMGGARVLANRVTGARYTGIELRPLFSIGLVDRFGCWIRCAAEWLIEFLRAFYEALCRFLEGEEIPDRGEEQDSFTAIGVVLIAGFMSLCARLCGDGDGGGGEDGGDDEEDEPGRPMAEDLKDAIGEFLERAGGCWLDDFLDGSYRVSRNDVRGGGTGIQVGIDGTRVDDNRITVDPDETLPWETVMLGILLAQRSLETGDEGGLVAAVPLMDLDRDLIFLLASAASDDQTTLPEGLGPVLAILSPLLAVDSPLAPRVAAVQSALSSDGNVHQEWFRLLLVIWGELRGYGIVVVGGDYCVTGNRVDAEESCLERRRRQTPGTSATNLPDLGKPPAIGGIWQQSNLVSWFEDILRLTRQDLDQRTSLVLLIEALLFFLALATTKNRELEVSESKVRRALTHGVFARSVFGTTLVELRDNRVLDAGRVGLMFQGTQGTVRALGNSVRRTSDVYGFLELGQTLPPEFARLVDIVRGLLAILAGEKQGGADILASNNHGDAVRLAGISPVGDRQGTSAIRLLGETVGSTGNHTQTDSAVAIEVQALDGLFTDNMSNRPNNVSPAAIVHAPNPTNL